MRVRFKSMLATPLLVLASAFPTLSFAFCISKNAAFPFESCILASSTNTDPSPDLNFDTIELQSIIGPDLPPIPPTSKRLFLIRHGEVVNPGGDRPVFYGALDVPLSRLGEAEALAAGHYLRQFDLQHIACSPLSRAIFGAKQIKSMQPAHNAHLLVYKGFSELDRGSWCGKTLDEIGPDNMERFDACDESVTPEGGESYLFLKSRVLEARRELLEATDCGNASAVVSHLQVTRSMLSDALDVPANEMVGLEVATASITCIDYDTKSSSKTVHYQSFKPNVGLETSKDGAN